MGAIFLLETTQTALNCVNLFYWFASGYGDITRLGSSNFSFFDGPIIESVVALIVQVFYAYRIWALSKKQSWWLCSLICLVSWSQASPKHLSLILFFHEVCYSRCWGRIHWQYLCECSLTTLVSGLTESLL